MKTRVIDCIRGDSVGTLVLPVVGDLISPPVEWLFLAQDGIPGSSSIDQELLIDWTSDGGRFRYFSQWNALMIEVHKLLERTLSK